MLGIKVSGSQTLHAAWIKTHVRFIRFPRNNQKTWTHLWRPLIVKYKASNLVRVPAKHSSPSTRLITLGTGDRDILVAINHYRWSGTWIDSQSILSCNYIGRWGTFMVIKHDRQQKSSLDCTTLKDSVQYDN